MSEAPKVKTVRFLRSLRASPTPTTIVEYAKGDVKTLPLELADTLLRDKDVEEVIDTTGPVILIPAWPPTDEQIRELSFSALGVLLEQREVPLGPLKSEDARREALREIILSEAPPPWPPGFDEGKVPDRKLAAHLKAAGVDLSTITSREQAEAKLRELMGVEGEEEAPEAETETPARADAFDVINAAEAAEAAQPTEQ